MPKNLADEDYEINDYFSKQNYKSHLLSKTVDGQNVKMLEYIYPFTNRNVPLYELVGTWNVNNRLDRRYLRYKALLQNIGNLTLDLERLLCVNTCFFILLSTGANLKTGWGKAVIALCQKMDPFMV